MNDAGLTLTTAQLYGAYRKPHFGMRLYTLRGEPWRSAVSQETGAARAAAVEIALKVLIAELSNHALQSGNPFGQRYLERLDQIATAAGLGDPLAEQLADFRRGIEAMMMR